MFNLRQAFKELILDEKRRIKVQFVAIYALFSLVAFAMTVVNIFTDKRTLMFSTLIFTAVCLLNFILSLIGKVGLKISIALFKHEILVLFSFFLIVGTPEGFSIIWSSMLPTLGVLIFKKKDGTIMSFLMFIILVFFFYTPYGRSFLQYDYTESFMLRFPLFYTACYVLALFFESLLESTFESYRNLFTHDPLTELYNRIGFNEICSNALNNKNEYIGFMIFDLDHFKAVNDTYGHLVGDEVLKKSAQILGDLIEEPICRWGGEEFAVCISDGNISKEECDMIVRKFSETQIIAQDKEIDITISLGAVLVKKTSSIDINFITNSADERLYYSKDHGRNMATFDVIEDESSF